MQPFLTARWVNLVLAQYPVPDAWLTPLLPNGVELERYDGSPVVSLVAFQFLDTRVFGCRWPGFVNFPELNLRTYVRQGNRRGVLFVREYVPSRIVAAVARWTYNEPYRTASMSAEIQQSADRMIANYAIRKSGQTHRIYAVGEALAADPGDDSLERRFTDLSWGFGRTRRGETLVYEVTHPVWSTYRVIDFGLDLDWAKLYGEPWSALNGRDPASVIFAAGSEVSVQPYQAGLVTSGTANPSTVR
jgi:uncharacterized protein YqjF (DUF2071 family)